MINYGFRFDIGSYYEIPPEEAGRIDLIAMTLYNSITYTAVLRVANRAGMPFFCRQTLRPSGAGRSDTWVSYDHPRSGMVTEFYQGRRLAVPTLASANEFLKQSGIA